jgi:hypothetical protein
MMQASPANSFPFSPLEFAILFIALWCLISFMVSLASGWFTLSRRFKKESEPYGQTKSAGPFFYSIYMRFRCHYGSVIRLTAAEDALYFSVLPILRIAHPPLRIPWTEIRMSRAKYLWVWPVVFSGSAMKSKSPCASRNGWPANWGSWTAFPRLAAFPRSLLPPSPLRYNSFQAPAAPET